MGLKTSNIVQDVYTNNYIDTIRDAINDCYSDDPTVATYVHPEQLPGLIRNIGGGGMAIIVLIAGQYNPETRVPTITDPSTKAIYLVPKTDEANSVNDYIEWIYVESKPEGDRWEKLGGDDSKPLTNDEIDEACTPLSGS